MANKNTNINWGDDGLDELSYSGSEEELLSNPEALNFDSMNTKKKSKSKSRKNTSAQANTPRQRNNYLKLDKGNGGYK